MIRGHTRFSVGKALVIGQIALSLVLVIGAGLLLGSFRRLTTLDPGFDRDGVLLVGVTLTDAGYASKGFASVHDDLLRRFRSLPGVRAASAAEITPVSGMAWNGHIDVDGHVATSTEDNMVWLNRVTDGFFGAMGTSLVAGRDFDERDRPTTPTVAIINETVARRFFAGTSPVGKFYRQRLHDTLAAPVEIVGVVRDAKYRELREDPQPTITSQWRRMNGARRMGVRAADGRPVVRDRAGRQPRGRGRQSLDHDRPHAVVGAARRLAHPRSADGDVVGILGAVALLLAAVGLYGTLSYAVARRNEIGIRIALGAARGRVVQLVVGEVARMVIVGVMLGAVAALASTRLVRSLLYGLSASDPATVIDRRRSSRWWPLPRERCPPGALRVWTRSRR